MCEVTIENFDNHYNDIADDFKKAVFISVDCEFSALHAGNEYRGSLFDTPKQRYQKLRKNLEFSIPLEIGLTTFSFDRDEIIYTAKPYKFYVFPPYFGDLDKIFTCQSSGFHFLREHKFNFNKVIYSGIPYLNLDQEKIILNYLHEDKLYEYCKYSISGITNNYVQNLGTSISEWYYTNIDEKEKVIDDVNLKNICLLYVLHKDIRNRFPKQIWTYEENNQLKIKRVTEQEYKEFDKKSPLDRKIYLHILGFTRIYRLLTSLKKPIVGHNCLNDLVLLINSFERTIPQSYTAFKQLTIERFPTVFDTKNISFELLKNLPEKQKWKSNILQDLYQYFKNETGRHLVPGSPRIEIDKFTTYTNDKFHDAGWDAYCTGYCFIRMAHFYAARDHEVHNKKIFMSSEHLKAVDQFKNHVNVIRATIPYLNLSGSDPESVRPPCLIIQSTNHKPVDIFKVTQLLREYGSVDIKPYSCKGRRAILAVGNYGCARRLLGINHDDFKIITYSSIKHSPVIRAALWGGAIASGSILAWLLHSQIMKSF